MPFSPRARYKSVQDLSSDSFSHLYMALNRGGGRHHHNVEPAMPVTLCRDDAHRVEISKL